MLSRAFWLPVLGALVGAGLGCAVGWWLAGDDLAQRGDWRAGAARFIGMAGGIGLIVGFLVTVRITRGAAVTRDGFTLSYKRIEPTAAGYRELTTLTVADLLAALRASGYEPRAEACDDVGTRAGALDADTPIAGANIALSDPRVRGWIRLHLPVPSEGQARGLGLLELWSERGESTEELGLFTLRALDGLIGRLSASRETSRHSDDPVALLTAGLGDRPRFR